MPNLTKRIVSKFFTPSSEEDKYIFKGIKAITGKRPYNLYLYKLAMKHTSMARVNAYGLKESNERLEYLGDSILGMI
ncbi:MAG: ribonuclease III, partial [Cyclobacteriaceae bacterium]|nr:ribonuclease III [Cyclobacteriaceae bacterium]